MITVLNFLGRHATVAMALGVFIGLAVQPLAAATKPLLMPAVWAVLTMSMMRLDPGAFFAIVRKPQRLGVMVIWMLMVTPVLMWVLVSDMPLSGGLIAALVLTAGSSALMSTPAIGAIMGLESTFILAMLVSTTFLLPLALPVTALVLLGLNLEIGVIGLMVRLITLIGSAALGAFVLRRIIGHRRIDEGGLTLDGFAVLLLWFFAIPLMDGITARLFAEPGYMLFVTVLSFAVYVGLMLVGALVFGVLWRDNRAALSAGLTSGCRNLAIIIAALPANTDPEIMTYFALAQFPIYIMPLLTKPVVERYLRSCAALPISDTGGPT